MRRQGRREGAGFDPVGNIAPEGSRPDLRGNPRVATSCSGSSRTSGSLLRGAVVGARGRRPALGAEPGGVRRDLSRVPARGAWPVGRPRRGRDVHDGADPQARGQDGTDVAWPATGSFGVYTYGAGGVKNAAQEIAVPVNFTEKPAPAFEPEVEVFAADGVTPWPTRS
ncbi:hypothetical protein NKG05_09230 [Oerskovia sp. M15]